jgi:hypothetical protein
VSIVTPEWVKDAVFCQVFPDRFARSGRVHPPGPLESWDGAPTARGFKGGDLYGVVAHLDHLGDLGVTALEWDPGLLAHVRAAVHLRHDNPVLRRRSFRVVAAAGPAIASLLSTEDAAVIVALDNGEEPATVELALAELEGRSLAPVSLPGDPAGLPGAEVLSGRPTIVIPARSGRVLHA